MELKIDNINKLPVRTFRWLGVNELNLQEEIPDIKPFNSKVIDLEDLGDIKLNGDVFAGDWVETGMGIPAVDYVNENKNSDLTLVVPKDKKVLKPVILNYHFDSSNQTLIDRTVIVARENSEVTLLLHYDGETDLDMFHGGLVLVKAEKNAVVHIIITQMLSDHGVNFSNLGLHLDDLAKVNIVTAELGSKSSAIGIHADLAGKESALDIQTIYFGDKDRSLDFNYIAKHKGIKTESNMDIHGALLDSSKKIFRGTIDFKKGAKGAKGSEGEYNLLFNKGIKNVSSPLILCEEDDVSGSHAANSGRIDEEKLFYMMSRGMDELTAKKIMLEAWFSPAIERIPSEELREQVSDHVKRRLFHVKSL
ncbi:MAG: Fe-S cluster assembly protein SufD [Anaerocolumna sp.]